MDAAHRGSKGKDVNDNHSFLFRDKLARQRTVRELQRLVWNSSGRMKKLKVESDATEVEELKISVDDTKEEAVPIDPKVNR